METLKDHLKTIAYIVGFIVAIIIVVYLFITFGEMIFVAAAIAMGLYTVYSIYVGVLNEIRQTRKRKEHKDVQQSEE